MVMVAEHDLYIFITNVKTNILPVHQSPYHFSSHQITSWDSRPIKVGALSTAKIRLAAQIKRPKRGRFSSPPGALSYLAILSFFRHSGTSDDDEKGRSRINRKGGFNEQRPETRSGTHSHVYQPRNWITIKRNWVFVRARTGNRFVSRRFVLR